MTWKDLLQSTRVRWALAFCGIILSMMVLYMPTYYREIIGPKKGLLLNDPILQLLSPADWSLVIFIILYLAVLQTFFSYFDKPDILIIGLTTYCFLNLFRMLTMYALTLEPPHDMILLADPISSIAYPDRGFAKDLFFSGHICTMMVLVLMEKKPIPRFLKIGGTVVMALLLAWQHVHYTLDLLVAPLATYGAYRITEANLKWQKPVNQG